MAKTVDYGASQSPAPLELTIKNIQAALCDFVMTTAGLAIGGTTTKVKIATAFKALIDGAYVHKAITDDAFTLAGTVTNATFNVYVMTMNASGTCTARMGTEGATRATVVWPRIPAGDVIVGFVEINPTGTGNFVGGTTALGDATVVPNAVYVNTPFPFNPNILTLPVV